MHIPSHWCSIHHLHIPSALSLPTEEVYQVDSLMIIPATKWSITMIDLDRSWSSCPEISCQTHRRRRPLTCNVCHVLSCSPAMLSYFMSCDMTCQLMSHGMSRDVMLQSYHIMSRNKSHEMSCQITCHVTGHVTCHITSHVMSHNMSCHITFKQFLLSQQGTGHRAWGTGHRTLAHQPSTAVVWTDSYSPLRKQGTKR